MCDRELHATIELIIKIFSDLISILSYSRPDEVFGLTSKVFGPETTFEPDLDVFGSISEIFGLVSSRLNLGPKMVRQKSLVQIRKRTTFSENFKNQLRILGQFL